MAQSLEVDQNNGPNILFGVTGSVAAIKTVDICKEILQQIEGANIKICTTKSAKHFIDLFGMNELKNEMKIEIYEDEKEWKSWNKRGDPVIHIELRKWADILIIAPLSANSLGKMANGICDNLITSVFRAWNFNKKHVIVAPAMNTLMWNNPFTEQHLSKLKNMFNNRFHIISPISKKLMCNDVGKGAMATPQTIVQITKNILQDEPIKVHKIGKLETGLLLFGLVCVVVFALKDKERGDKTTKSNDMKWWWF